MTITALGPGGALPQSIVDLKTRLNELQLQLGTGRKAATYGGLGSGRTIALGMRAEISRIESFRATITTLDLRFNVINGALEGAQDIVDDVRGALLLAPYDPGPAGKSQIQFTAEANLSQLVELLNSEANGRHLFAGRDVDKRPVASDRVILEGEPGRAGLAQVTAERAAADLGADGLGRLVVPASVASLSSLAEDVAGHPFGFKLTSVTSNLSGTTVSGPAGAPATIDVTFTASLPVAGESLAVEVALPDGTRSEIRLRATQSATPGPGEFTIGADETATAANFSAALSAEVARVASVDLKAASAVEAANNFFDYDAGNPPQRVDGPPFDTATALVDASPANTVFWYRGDLDTPARASAVARVDDGLLVEYGARADEAALRSAVKHVATIAVARFNAADPADALRYEQLKLRVTPALSEAGGNVSVRDLATELAQKHNLVTRTDARHQEALAVAESMLGDTVGVNLEEVGVMFLRLQTQLQASYETTSILSRLSLVNFL